MRATLPAGAACVVKAGHLVDAHSVRFYAPDSEQAGLLAASRRSRTCSAKSRRSS